ncbi:hypothetical protein FEM48_Zijuj06G0195200 [Ziziphus jujuba var. spinosa]|uniref:Uncharacterized protein n=1 Tax=Ziziphus jujuba var. spinosa TaxID=714518 RepID=A0A978VB72_ZIZJJ|nr:hypothetical protein FEM48_Zijuj06G0195200 [Ziziphus jujuba var. spinosa]
MSVPKSSKVTAVKTSFAAILLMLCVVSNATPYNAKNFVVIGWITFYLYVVHISKGGGGLNYYQPAYSGLKASTVVKPPCYGQNLLPRLPPVRRPRIHIPRVRIIQEEVEVEVEEVHHHHQETGDQSITIHQSITVHRSTVRHISEVDRYTVHQQAGESIGRPYWDAIHQPSHEMRNYC